MQKYKMNAMAAAVALLAGSAILAGCGQPHAAGGAAAPGPTEVGVVTVQAQKLALTTELAGRTSAYQVSEVRPQVGGIIQKRQFTEGGEVKAGQPLYQIDPATYQATYDSAKASLAKAEASLVSARNKASRYKDLVQIKGVSQQDFDDADASSKQAEADVAAARAAVETARINLAYTKVASPISGRIGKSSVTPGALVTASQQSALTTVTQLDPIYVDVTQSSTELLRLKRDLASGRLKSAGANQAAVQLVLEDGTPYSLPGKLQFSDVTVDQSTGTINLRAVFPNPKGDLLPGMYVRAILEEGVDEQALLVPQQGVSRDTKGNPTALVVGADGTVQQRELKTARTIGDKWLVTDGVKPGDQVIVEGLQKVRPGAPAKAVPVAKSAAAPAPVAQR
jgi:membrane fusion protein (multidrug efflux system)